MPEMPEYQFLLSDCKEITCTIKDIVQTLQRINDFQYVSVCPRWVCINSTSLQVQQERNYRSRIGSLDEFVMKFWVSSIIQQIGVTKRRESIGNTTNTIICIKLVVEKV